VQLVERKTLWKEDPEAVTLRLFAHVPIAGFPTAASAICMLSDGALRRRLVLEFIELWARFDPDSAAAWAGEHLSPEDPVTAAVRAALAVARVDDGVVPSDLGDSLSATAAGHRRRLQGRLFDRALHVRDIGTHAHALLAAIPPVSRSGYLVDLVDRWAKSAPADACAWALTVPDASHRELALRTAIPWFIAFEEDAAEDWLASLGGEGGQTAHAIAIDATTEELVRGRRAHPSP
jgi:hypothetical protein